MTTISIGHCVLFGHTWIDARENVYFICVERECVECGSRSHRRAVPGTDRYTDWMIGWHPGNFTRQGETLQ